MQGYCVLVLNVFLGAQQMCNCTDYICVAQDSENDNSSKVMNEANLLPGPSWPLLFWVDFSLLDEVLNILSLQSSGFLDDSFDVE